MKKSMGSILLIIGLLLLFAVSGMAEESPRGFVPEMINIMEYSGEEWFANKISRALITVLMASEYAQENEDYDATTIATESSYVQEGDEDSSVTVYLHDGEKLHMILYDSELEMAFYSSLDVPNELAIEAALDKTGQKYYRNSISTIYDVVMELKDVLEDI